MVKKRVKKKAGKSPAQIKKDLAIFEKGVERLKELESELNNLDTRGFAYDEQKIRQKLKNVSDIPAIEKGIKSLRLKIQNKYKPKKKKGQSKVIKKLDKLEDKLDDITKSSKKKVSPKVSKQLEVLSKKLASMERSCQKKKGNIDSGVGVLIDTDFNAFLTDIKTRLSDRIRGKEAEVEAVLKSDLQKRELEFKKKHDNLVREFNIKKRKLSDAFEKKYALQVRSSLKKEVAQKFNAELKKKLDSEKVSLGKRYKSELKMHAEDKLKKEEDAMRKKLENKITALERSFNKKHDRLERELGEKYEEKVNIFEKMKAAFKAKEETEMEAIVAKKRKLIEEKEKLEEAKKKEVDKIKKSLNDKFHRELDSELKRKEGSIRARVKREYELMLKQKIAEHEDQLKKKKVDLELELQRKMKEALN